uniref:Lipoic acid synthetase n=1 Tax=Cyprinus carpio TaxID=7962 RepID=A0A8C2BG08_CYPCA
MVFILKEQTIRQRTLKYTHIDDLSLRCIHLSRDMKEKALNLQDFISGELSEKSKCEEDRDRREKGKRMDTPLSFWCMNVEIFQYRGFYQSVCEEAWCPSIGKCWAGGEYATATVMLSKCGV